MDTDRRVPFVFAPAYVMFYGEDLLMSVPEYFIGNVYAWLADEDTARPAAPERCACGGLGVDGHGNECHPCMRQR